MALISPWRERIDAKPEQAIEQLYKEVLSWRQDHQDRWDDYYSYYRSYIDEDSHPWRANLFIPYTFSLVETVTPKMLGAIFNTKPIVSIVTRKGNEMKPDEMQQQMEMASDFGLSSLTMPTGDMAQLIERLLDYQFEEESLEFYFMLEQFFKDAAIYGTAFGKVVPEFKDDAELTLDFINFKPVDLYNIFPDWRATSLKDAKFIIERREVDFDELIEKQEQGIYENVDELKEYAEEQWKVDEFRHTRLGDVDINEQLLGDFSSSRKSVMVLEYWDREKIYHIGAGKVVLLEDDNPFGDILPYVMLKYCNVPHEFYGIGLPEMVEPLQEELNAIRNQRMDNVNLIINRMFLVNKLADVDIDNLISYPGNVIATNDMEAVEPLQTADISMSIYREEEIIKGDIENTTGEWRYGRGGTPEHRETATGIIKLQQAANVRFDAVLKNVEFTFREIAKLFIWYNSQFLDPENFAKIVGFKDFINMGGQYFYELPVEEMLKLYHFQPVGSSTTAVRELRIQQIMQIYELGREDMYFNQYELRRLMLNAMDVKDHDKILKTDEQVQQEQQRQMYMQAQAEAIAAGKLPEGSSTMGGGVVGGEQKPISERQMAGMTGSDRQAPGRAVTQSAGTEAAMI